MKKDQRALLLFSGGQDSTLCLLWALQHYKHVETVGFDYGQRHTIELTCRLDILNKLRTLKTVDESVLGADHMINLTSLGDISDTALTREREISFSKTGLPTSFVPGRNLLFFTYAAAIAYRRDLPHLIGGMCEADFSGYPDCRTKTLQSLEETLNLGLESAMEIITPLMHKTKAECLTWAQELGGNPFMKLFIEDTHSCYLGTRDKLYDWGYGCGTCPACELRKSAYKTWKDAS